MKTPQNQKQIEHLQNLSFLVRDNSMYVNKEFDEIEFDIDETSITG